MQSELAGILVDPGDLTPLRLVSVGPAEVEVEEGVLVSRSGREFPIRKGIPRFVAFADRGQEQTSGAFGFKWKRWSALESPAAREAATRWYLAKYGYASLEEWACALQHGERVLDLGCGSGFSSSLWLETSAWTGRTAWIGVDISEAVDVARSRLSGRPNAHFVQADALALPFSDGTFGVVFSEGVLHHTPSTQTALLSGARVLAPGGTFAFYVYRKKSPVREFTDDYVRQAIAPLSDEDAWEALRGLTELGRALAELKATVELPPIPLLGIPGGRHDVQRLVYWHFAKLFWNPECSFEENLAVNFDWYRPAYAHRQTEEQVRAWCAEAGLDIERFHADEAGFAVRARKR